MQKRFTFMSTHDDIIKVHRCGCAHINREKRKRATWSVEADSVEEAIESDRQDWFEQFGGQGSYRDAEPDDEALPNTEYQYDIIDCAR